VVVDIWTFRSGTDLGADVTRGVDVTGFGVEAIDGSIGKVDEATYDVGKSYVVVDTGPWIFGKKVLLPAGVIDRIDLENEKVFVHRTKDEIKSAPELDLDRSHDTDTRSEVGSYYSQGGGGWREWGMIP
jgi:hypothetical protein